MDDPRYEPAMKLAEVREGGMRSCRIAGREVVICRTREGVFALDNICSHAYARMSEGYLRGTRIVCPLHGASFDVRTGNVIGAPAVRPITAHRARIVEDGIEVAVDPAAPKPLEPF